ncbi:MAG: DNA-binding response regulator [Crocinitomicaceae bacterium]|nr:DNA-binding response regulator [Crocinitomicaceae bacterium]|tara:strand:+ start:1016 stop:1654 length:639 start_codon:yes stop_codon:yes gene_type:complete
MDSIIKVLIVDDHKLIGEAWSSLLKDAPNIQVVGLADNVDDAYSMAHSYKPDIVLMDINLGAGSGFDATEKINDSMPKTRVIGLSLHDDITYVKKFLSIGAKGYLTKNTNKTELIEAIHSVYKGETIIGSDIKDRYFTSLLNVQSGDTKKELTMKEIEIVKLISKGFTSKEIAEQLFISHRTVETHRHNILKKLDMPNAAQLSSWAKEKGYV